MTDDTLISLPCIPSDLVALLVEQAYLAGGGRLALVGGAVRDAMLHYENRDRLFGPKDFDFVLEGSCVAFVQHLQDQYSNQRLSECRFHERYSTAEFAFDGVLIDLACARTEIYPAPGENPLVKAASIEQDLARRDFSVNAMGLLFCEDGSLHLCDPFNGREHLAKRELVFLHEASVADDPTRIVRGARYGARLGFNLAPEALSQIQSTIALWPWAWQPGDSLDAVPPALGTRLRMELELLLDLEPAYDALKLLQQWSAMPLLDVGLQNEPRISRRLIQAKRLGLPALSVLVAAASDPVSLAMRLQVPRQQQIWLEALIDLRCWLELEVKPYPWGLWGALDWTQRLEQMGWPPEAVALAVLDSTPFRRPLLHWWGRWRHVRSPWSARELIAQGMSPGPALGDELKRLREQDLRKMR